MNLSKNEVNDIIIGSLLGDGSVEKPSGGSKKYVISFHQNKDHESNYIKFKYDQISKFYKTNPIRNGNNNTLRFTISRDETNLIESLRDITRYNNNSRKLPDIDSITPLVLLLWYLDDGSLAIGRQKRPNRKSSIYRKLRIHLVSYRDLAILNFIEQLELKFGLKFKENYEIKTGKDTIVSIGISNNIEEIVKFLDIIYPYKDIIPQEMHYKFCLCFHETRQLKNNKYLKYNICNFHETGICTCRSKNLKDCI